MLLFDYLLKRVQAMVPELLVKLQPGKGVIQHARLGMADTLAAVFNPPDQAGPFQHTQVLGHRWKADRELRGDVIDGKVLFPDLLQDAAPGGI